MANNPEDRKRTKYINLRYHYLREKVTNCQSSRKYGAEGPGQLLIRIRDLGCNRGRDGYAPAPRRDRAIGTAFFKGLAVSALAL
jgi:hypothetical protein